MHKHTHVVFKAARDLSHRMTSRRSLCFANKDGFSSTYRTIECLVDLRNCHGHGYVTITGTQWRIDHVPRGLYVTRRAAVIEMCLLTLEDRGRCSCIIIRLSSCTAVTASQFSYSQWPCSRRPWILSGLRQLSWRQVMSAGILKGCSWIYFHFKITHVTAIV